MSEQPTYSYIVPKNDMDRLVEFSARAHMRMYRAQTMIFFGISIVFLMQLIASALFDSPGENVFVFCVLGFMTIFCFSVGAFLQARYGYDHWHRRVKEQFDVLMYEAHARYEIERLTTDPYL